MSIVFSKDIEQNHVDFTWGEETLAFREATQIEIDGAGKASPDQIHEQAKKHLELRISGKAKEAFLEEWYKKKSALSLITQLNEILLEEKTGK